MKAFKNVIEYLWQLPQNLVGLVVVAVTRAVKEKDTDGRPFWRWHMESGISLGHYVCTGWRRTYWDKNHLPHERGHQKQSLYLGPLYLLVIGLPSIIWAGLYSIPAVRNRWSYYAFYTEAWADRLGHVDRNERQERRDIVR